MKNNHAITSPTDPVADAQPTQHLASMPDDGLDLRVLRHDLLAALRHVDTVTSFIVEDVEADKASETVVAHSEAIRERTDLARNIVDGFLGFHAATDRQPIEAANIRRIVDNVVGLQAEKTDVTFVIDAPASGEWQPIYLEAIALTACLEAVVDNAVVHRASNSGSVVIEAFRTANDVEFIIRDDGYGIAPGLWDVVFEPLRKIDRVRSNYRGVGFGLAIARRLAESRGGHVNIVASDDSGTTMSVRWPIPVPVRNTRFAQNR